jgi:hypothetical protein
VKKNVEKRKERLQHAEKLRVLALCTGEGACIYGIAKNSGDKNCHANMFQFFWQCIALRPLKIYYHQPTIPQKFP